MYLQLVIAILLSIKVLVVEINFHYENALEYQLAASINLNLLKIVSFSHAFFLNILQQNHSKNDAAIC